MTLDLQRASIGRWVNTLIKSGPQTCRSVDFLAAAGGTSSQGISGSRALLDATLLAPDPSLDH
eukprot:3692552-Pyramimonas_sp.AAC.1